MVTKAGLTVSLYNYDLYVPLSIIQVMACSWDEMWKDVTEAADLDKIIAAHEVFLDTILRRALLDEESRVRNRWKIIGGRGEERGGGGRGKERERERYVRAGEDLDKIIAAHEVFLDTILRRALLDEESRVRNRWKIIGRRGKEREGEGGGERERGRGRGMYVQMRTLIRSLLLMKSS